MIKKLKNCRLVLGDQPPMAVTSLTLPKPIVAEFSIQGADWQKLQDLWLELVPPEGHA